MGHIILVQQPTFDCAAILLTAVLPADGRDELVRVAAYTLNRLSISAALELLPLPSAFQLPNVRVRRGRLVFPEQGAPSIGNGDSIVVERAQQVFALPPNELQEEEETSLMQIEAQIVSEPNFGLLSVQYPIFLLSIPVRTLSGLQN